MKVEAQVLYATMSGHSRKIAQAIAKETGLPIYDLKETTKLHPSKLLFLVSGIYGGKSKEELLSFLKTLSSQEVEKVVLLTSSTRGTASGGLRKTLEEAGISVAQEEYLCRGGFLFLAMGHPNQDEIQGAVDFVKKQLPNKK